MGKKLLSDNDDEVKDCELMSSDDVSNDDNTEETGDLESNSDACEIHAPEVPTKRKSINIDEIAALDNFDNLPPREQNVFHYSDAKGTFVMNWYTDKKSLVRRAPACNVSTVRPAPRDDAKNFSNLSESFHLFISDDMMNEILTNTNNSISDFVNAFVIFQQVMTNIIVQ